MVYVYLLCFLQQRYQRLHDHLLSGFMHAVKDYRDDANTAAKAQVAAYHVRLTDDLVRAGQVLRLFTGETIPPDMPFATVQERAFGLGEQYHHLKRALTQANAGKLRYGTDDEQDVWNECSRLLINAILYYNMLMLSEAVTRREQRGDTVGAEQLKAVSPVAWTHVNCYGRYTFNEEPLAVPIDGFVETMAKYAFSIEAPIREETIER